MTVQNNLVEGVGGLASGTEGRSQPSALPVGYNKLDPSPFGGAFAVDQEARAFRKAGGIVAAFYYGEWTTPGTSYNPNPWDCMQPYADRLPVISQKISAGVYGLPADNAAAVEWEQRQAIEAGVDVFIHNAYWIKDPAMAPPANICHANLALHAACPTPQKFAVQWSNHETWITTIAEFNAAIDYMLGWAKNYPAKYWQINGLPVFYIWSMDNLKTVAQAVFAEPEWIVALEKAVTQIKARAVALGLPGVFLVSCAGNDHPLWTGRAYGFVGVNERIGCGAQTVYNRHSAYTERTQNQWGGDAVWATRYPQALSVYDQLTEVYRIADDWILNGSGSQLPVFASAICGWDRRPWAEKAGQTAQPEDNCAASPEQWLEHLRQQRAFAMAGTRSKPGVPPVVNAYAWNEYGEGGFLCPSRRYGWQLLDQVKRTFGLTGEII